METYRLTNDTVDLLSGKISEAYEALGADKKEILRTRLLVEELLLKYQSRFGEEIEISYRQYRLFSQVRFCLTIRAPSFDPFTLEENPMAFMLQSLMMNYENAVPSWRYRNMENEVVFTVRKQAKIGSLFKIAAALIVSLVTAIILRAVLPQEKLLTAVNDYIMPITNAYAGLFCVMAVLMTFFAIVMGIIHMGNASTAGAVARRIIRRSYGLAGILTVILTCAILPLFSLSGENNLFVTAKSIYDILIEFVPTNFVAPFLNFNSIQIIIIGAMFGFSLLAMGQKGDRLTGVFDECNLVAVTTNTFINKFIFLYVGLNVFSIVSVSEFSSLIGAAKMVGAIVAGQLLLVVFYTCYARMRSGIPFSRLIRKLTPTFLINLSSANFGASFSSNFDALAELEVDTDLIGMELNLGGVIFKPAYSVVFAFSSLFMASEYGVKISIVWVVTAVLLSVILVSAVPNVPGAAIPVFALLFTQLGLPAEALSEIISINAILEFLTVAANVWCLQSETLCCDARVKSLRKKSKKTNVGA